MALLEISGLEVRYPGRVRALRGVSLSLAAGETLALVGESGSGKSTLLQCVNRMVVASGGRVRFESQDIADAVPEDLRRRIGYVQQEGGLLPHWTVRRNMGLVARILGWESSRIDSRVAELLVWCGCKPAASAPVQAGQSGCCAPLSARGLARSMRMSSGRSVLRWTSRCG